MTVSRLHIFAALLSVGMLTACSQTTTSPVAPAVAGGTDQTGGSPNSKPPRPDAAEIRGQVSGLSGGCPTLTFTLDSTVVHTDSSTRFEGGGCGEVANGIPAAAAGKKQDDGSILAKVVKVGKPHRPERHTVAGKISDLAGSCPALTFHVGHVPVVTDSSTVFEGQACGDLANGMPVRVSGTAGDGHLQAARVDSRKK